MPVEKYSSRGGSLRPASSRAFRRQGQGPASASRLVRRFPGRFWPSATPTRTNRRKGSTGSASTRVVPPWTEEFPEQQKPADTPRGRLPGRIAPNIRYHIRHGRSSIGQRRCTTIVWPGESNKLAGPAELPLVCEQCENALLSSLRSFFSVRLPERQRNPLRLGQHQPWPPNPRCCSTGLLPTKRKTKRLSRSMNAWSGSKRGRIPTIRILCR